MRADAAERRQRLIEVAREILVERGPNAPLDAIAKQAGVGIATLYRNFPTREALLEAVAVASLTEAHSAAVSATELADTDPERALTEFLMAMARFRTGALLPMLADQSLSELPASVHKARARNIEIIDDLLAKTAAAGVTRPDIDTIQFISGLALLTRPLPPLAEVLPANNIERLLTIYQAGLRPDGKPLP
ncbi:TetR/AcrR family transcriptional regulator [Jongsikchunia kroppenstedtii]|uniref:TetR/AcrR family transcriptional regulator n=1 Tax=Jongsikchunia kroppenstedtii TaxID=1121721 RepID=UPI0003AA3D79|nr:TetR/AcrR family transcriptional regulator [Jongsikchunia kroppenstedtii]